MNSSQRYCRLFRQYDIKPELFMSIQKCLILQNIEPVPLKSIKLSAKMGRLPLGIRLSYFELSRYVNSCYSNCTVSRRMFSSVPQNSFLQGQLLHSLNVIYLAERTALAAIFISFNRMVLTCCFRIFAGSTSRLNQLNKLYASMCIRIRLAFTTLE